MNFVAEVMQALPGAKLLVICDSGGNYQPKVGNNEGRRSRRAPAWEERLSAPPSCPPCASSPCSYASCRSLVAIHKLMEAGVTDLLHVAGGTRAWGEEDLGEFVGTSPDEWVNKAGMMPPSS